MIIELSSNDHKVMIQWYNDMMIMCYNDDNVMIAIEKQPKTRNWVIPPTKGPFELKSQYILQPTSPTKKLCKKNNSDWWWWLYLLSTFHSTIGWFIPVDVAGPHRCSWIGYSTLGMHKLLTVTARQGKKISCFVYPFGCVLVVGWPTRYVLNNDATLYSKIQQLQSFSCYFFLGKLSFRNMF